MNLKLLFNSIKRISYRPGSTNKTFSTLQIKKPDIKQLNPPNRLLCGAGPSNCYPSIYDVMNNNQVGHLDPFFFNILKEVNELLRYAWQTNNKFILPISGTGSAAWETVYANLIEEEDVILTGIKGFFGERNLEFVEKYGGINKTINKKWGQVFSLDEIEDGIKKYKPKIFHLVHAETSTGVLQPIEGIGEICERHNCLFVLDTITSLGGVPVYLDEWKVDVSFSAGQKCLGCPPGISSLTLNNKALDIVKNRKSSIKSWYFDLNKLADYIIPENNTKKRIYHHTAPIANIYSLHEALRILKEEGLESSWKRHEHSAELLYKKLNNIDIELFVKDNHSPMLTSVIIPEHYKTSNIPEKLLYKHNIEIGVGLDVLSNQIWRFGLMGKNANDLVVNKLFTALDQELYSLNMFYL
jgi:alanine-glyoxylate transaminase / serine-glyoxylate transaminase / serine-pyruvate transaminase